MASEAQRKKREKLKALQEEAEESGDPFGFGDMDLEEADDLDTFERLTRLTKGPLHLLLMVRTPGFPLDEKSPVYVRAQDLKLGEIWILSDGRLKTDYGIKDSLSMAVWAYRPDKHKSHPDGWEYSKVPSGNPGQYISLNQLFIDNWELFGIKLETLLDDKKLAEYMVEKQLATASEPPLHQIFNRKVRQSGKISKKKDASKGGSKK